MLGPKSVFIKECQQGDFVGVNFDIGQDLTKKLPDNWREFNREFIPVWLEKNTGKNKISAGLACGFLFTVAKGMKKGDLIISPDGTGKYIVGEIIGEYTYNPGTNLPHRRPIQWYSATINRDDMSEALRNSASSIGTVSQISKYAEEIERLIEGQVPSVIISTDKTIEEPSVFALEQHLEEFLIQNWKQTEFGKQYDIFSDDNGSGRQYPTETGAIDILAISKDKKELLVVELKRGRASDSVVGQLLRYMGDVKEAIAEKSQLVKGVIIALEDDIRIRRAIAVTNNVEFYRYQVSFKLIKV